MSEVKLTTEDKINTFLEGNKNFILKSVTAINHRPRPYEIGTRHIKYASVSYGGILGKEVVNKVHCAHPKCSLMYDDHRFDNIAFLQLKRDADKEDAQKDLESIIKCLDKDEIDGFVFVETKEKFRII